MKTETSMSPMDTWEELFARDPLSLSEEDVDKITKHLVYLCRKEIEIWNGAKEVAKQTNTRMSGTAVKKQQALAAGISGLDSFFQKKEKVL